MALSFVIVKAQYVLIPDSNFRHALISRGYASCFDTTLTLLDTTCSLVINTSVLDVDGSGISDLNGVQYFKSLDSLVCVANQLKVLPLLPNSLRVLDCRSNQLSVIVSLPDSLLTLSCSYNEIDSIGDLPSGLIELNCFFNHLIHLPHLPNSLSILICGDNRITALPTLPNSIRSVDCSSNQLTFLPMLPDSLNILYCGANSLTTLPVLPRYLSRLECLDNHLTSLPDLPDSLGWFNFNTNPDLRCLPHLNKVLEMVFFNTGISCLPNYPQGNRESTPNFYEIPLCQSYNTSECTDYPLSLLSVYPIPTFSSVTFSIIDHTVSISEIKLTDIIGNIIFTSKQIDSFIYTFQISNYSAGFYFYEITTNVGQTFKGKFEYIR